MADTVTSISRSLSADVQQLSTISHNVANMQTPGYRAMRSIPGATDDARLLNYVDRSEGALSVTTQRLDLALRGDGFFVVERGGQLLLTRSGSFRLDASGALVTAVGDRVLGQSGPLVLSSPDMRVDATGDVWVGARVVDRLQIIRAAEPARLRPAGAAAFAYDGPMETWSGHVVQGALEQSNVDPAEQTLRLMELTRHVESVQRAISIYDKAMDAGINRLGDN